MTALLGHWILTLLVFIPTAGALLLFTLPKGNERLIRNFALGVAIVEMLLSLVLVRGFVPGVFDFQFAESRLWLPAETGIRYIVGVDGLSLILILLTTILSPLVLLSTYSSVEKNVRAFLALFLVLESAMIGTFVALDLVLFYVLWEAMLIPMYFMIGAWGGSNRIYATIKFFLFTAFGSLLMLVAFAYIYYAHANLNNGVFSTNLLELYKTTASLSAGEQFWLFAALTFAFAIKVPMFPVHTWLPDAHVEAPTAGSVILAGVLLKMGTYGLMRFSVPMFPLATHTFAPIMMILGIIGIVYGALIAWRQTDIKKLIAYSSVSHLGFVVVGIFSLTSQGFTGSLYQMVNHGVSTGALFLLVGVIYERRHTRQLSEFGGLAKQMPWYTTFFMVATLGSVALPGTGGFVGEWMILWGAFTAHPAYGATAALGVVLGAVYMLWLVLKMFWGPLNNPKNQTLKDVSFREGFILGTLSIAVFALGIFSTPLLEHAQSSLLHLHEATTQKKPYALRLLTEAEDKKEVASAKGSAL
jgi:NADH-quinone oxidoreductase subunit M